MLHHSPPLPLIIDHIDHSNSIATEDEEGIRLALQHHDRVRRIRLLMPIPNLQKVIVALDNEFPMLKWLYIRPSTELVTNLVLPKSFSAPHLCHLRLSNFVFPIGTPLLTSAVGIVTLSLDAISPSVFFHPNDLVHRLSQMPQLKRLSITFHSLVPNLNVNREQPLRSLTTNATLPNLRWFEFKGTSAYLETLLPCITAPLLAKLQILFFNQTTFHLPHLLQFLNAAESLKFSSARLFFMEEWFTARMYPNKDVKVSALFMRVRCQGLNWQVASAEQIFSMLRSAFSEVEHLTLKFWGYRRHNEADRTQWRNLLRSFSNVKTLRVANRLVSLLSLSLQLQDGESPMELLPELKELSYSSLRQFDNAFTAFIDARCIAGRPATVVRQDAFL